MIFQVFYKLEMSYYSLDIVPSAPSYNEYYFCTKLDSLNVPPLYEYEKCKKFAMEKAYNCLLLFHEGWRDEKFLEYMLKEQPYKIADIDQRHITFKMCEIVINRSFIYCKYVPDRYKGVLRELYPEIVGDYLEINS